MASITFGSTAGSRPYGVLTVTQSSQNIANNTTTVSYSLVLKRPSKINSSASKSWSVTINGTKFSGSGSIGGSGNKTLLSGTHTITHNSDGTKSISFSASIGLSITWSGSSLGTISGSGSMTLSTIARATQPSTNLSAQAFGSAITINTPRASSGFTHNLYYNFVTSGDVLIASGVGTSYTWTIPLALMNYIPNSTTSWITIKCNTYNGSTYIGQKTCTFDLSVPSSIVPSISSIGISEATAGLAAKFGAYIQNKSTLKVSVNAAGAYSSTIKSYSTSVTGSNGGTAQSFTTGILSQSGTVTIISTITDSRGRNASKSTTISVLAYNNPYISKFFVERCDSNGTVNSEGLYLKCTLSFSIVSLNSKNNKSVSIQYKLESQGVDQYKTLTTYTDVYSVNDRTYVSTVQFSVDESYSIRLVVSDYFGSSQVETRLNTSPTILNFDPDGFGIGVGTVAETNKFKVAYPSEFMSDVDIEGSLLVTDASSFLGPLQIPNRITGNNIPLAGSGLNNGNSEIGSNITEVSKFPSFIGTITRSGGWLNLISCRHRNGAGDGTLYGMALYSGLTHDDSLYFRHQSNGSWLTERKIMDSSNYNSIMDSGWQDCTYQTGFTRYSNAQAPLQVRRIGNIVHLRGSVRRVGAITPSSETSTAIGRMPSGYAPAYTENFICQGSMANRFLLSVNANGYLYIARYTDSTTANEQVPDSAWLNCYATWFLG